MRLHSTVAVSYTHLDVYKRQEFNLVPLGEVEKLNQIGYPQIVPSREGGESLVGRADVLGQFVRGQNARVGLAVLLLLSLIHI